MGQQIRSTTLPDGRLGYPGVVVYRLTEGPDKGKELLAPPVAQEHPSPYTVPEAMQKGIAYHKSTTCAYRIIVIDQVAYDALVHGGWIFTPCHHGANCGRIVDNRITS